MDDTERAHVVLDLEYHSQREQCHDRDRQFGGGEYARRIRVTQSAPQFGREVIAEVAQHGRKHVGDDEQCDAESIVVQETPHFLLGHRRAAHARRFILGAGRWQAGQTPHTEQ